MPYQAASYQLVYGNLYNNLNEYYDSPYDVTIGVYLAAGTYSNNQWYSAIPKNYYDFMQDSVLNNIQNNFNHPAMQASRKNDLHNWVAYEPIRLFYCGMDSMVSPLNSIAAVDTMMAIGSTDVTAFDLDSLGTHETCFIPTTTHALNWFDSLLVPCQIVGLNISEIELKKMIFYPSPVEGILTYNSNQFNFINVYNLQGELVLQSQGNTIDMTNLMKGIYLVEALNMSSGKVYIQKIQKN